MKKPLTRCLAVLASLLTLHAPFLVAQTQAKSQLTTLANGGDPNQVVDNNQAAASPVTAVGTTGPGAGMTGPGAGPGVATTQPATKPAATINPPNPDPHVVSDGGGSGAGSTIEKIFKSPLTMIGTVGVVGAIAGAFAFGGPLGLLAGAAIGLLVGMLAIGMSGHK